MRSLISINVSRLEAMTDDGAIFPITNFFGSDGEEIAGPEGAVSFVAGPDAHGKWWLAEISAFGGTRH